MTKKTLLLFSYILLFLQLNAQETNTKKKYIQAYSGGMMLHTGYLFGGELNIADSPEKMTMAGAPLGIGGMMRFHIGKHFCIGGEGYNSSLHYDQYGSYMTFGWGGFLMNYQWEINKYAVFVGGTIGGGSVKNTLLSSKVSSHATEKNAVYRKYSMMVATPFVGMEYTITNRIHLVSKIDYMVNLSSKPSDFAKGFRIYAGMVFYHGM